jgi:lipopolysaccharide/colanic/teichoic acid biosynthesis glycosyltransferase
MRFMRREGVLNIEARRLSSSEVIEKNYQLNNPERAYGFAVAEVNRSSSASLTYVFVKRFADVVISLCALVLLSPIILIVALIVKLQDGGPILYKQTRVGKLGKTFNFYKFRSMRVDADKIRQELLHLSDAKGAAFKMKHDPRRTPFGTIMRKYSLDELPQIFAVLVGHMSVIGPRPHLPSEVETYTQEQHLRLSVKPGLICLREIKGRSHLSFEEWLRLDLEYVETRSLFTDLKIFLLSIPAVLSGHGAY